MLTHFKRKESDNCTWLLYIDTDKEKNDDESIEKDENQTFSVPPTISVLLDEKGAEVAEEVLKI